METDNLRRMDPAFTRFVTASIEEIRYAQELRRQIERRYLGASLADPDADDERRCIAAY